MYTLETLKQRLKEIEQMGYIPTHRSGPTGIGKTLEDLLGINENNIAGADLGDLGELKSCRNNQTSMITLFTKSPKPPRVNGILLNTYGYVDPRRGGRKILHSTVSGTSYNTVNGTPYGFKVEVVGDRLYLKSNFPQQVIAYWEKEDLKKAFEKKLPKLIFVKANCKGTGRNEEFHFVEAYQLSGFSFKNFEELINRGIIKIDIRIGQYPDGRTHDHGTAFRIMNNQIYLCFAHRIKLL